MAKEKVERKRCPSCGSSRLISKFASDKSSKDGRYRICKACEAVARAARRAAVAA